MMSDPVNTNHGLNLITDTPVLVKQICLALNEFNFSRNLLKNAILKSPRTSSVLFLLGLPPKDHPFYSEPSLILNKRSVKVKQPGDLCCPGGSVSSCLDPFIAWLLYLPGSPLSRWQNWSLWHQNRRREAKSLSVLLATALREGFEEMRLNPFSVDFLGPMPLQRLVTFNRDIYPMACWVSGQKRFSPNREVEKIIYIPLKELLKSENYACYRLSIKPSCENGNKKHFKDLPCFLHKQNDESERLWGATYRMAIAFLEIVFGFTPPPLERLPVVHGVLHENYLIGSKLNYEHN